MDHLTCRTCRKNVVPSVPRTLRKVLNVAFWIAALTTATGFSILLGLNVVLVPLWLFIGMSVGTSAALAAAWTCPECKSEMIVPAEVQREIAARRHTHRPMVPAHA